MTWYGHKAIARAGLVLALGIAVAVCGAYGAQIALGLPIATTDGGYAVPVAVTPDAQESVAAVQFDVQFDASQYTFATAVAGDVALQAGKDALFSEPASGVVRVIVAGLNQQTVGAGDVATLYFQSAGKANDSDAFALSQVVVSDPLGGKNEASVSASTEEDSSATDTAESRSSAENAVSSDSAVSTASTSSAAASLAKPASVQSSTGSAKEGTAGTAGAVAQTAISLARKTDGHAGQADGSGSVSAKPLPIAQGGPAAPVAEGGESSSDDTGQRLRAAPGSGPALPGEVSSGDDEVSSTATTSRAHRFGGRVQKPGSAAFQVAQKASVPPNPFHGTPQTRIADTGVQSGPVAARNAMMAAALVLVCFFAGVWFFKRLA